MPSSPASSGTIGSRIRLARIAAEKSVIQLAALCDVTRQTVHYWEHTEIADVDSIMALRVSYVLHVRPEWLILGREPMHPDYRLRELQQVVGELPDPAVDRVLGFARRELGKCHAIGPAFRSAQLVSSARHGSRAT